jgi:hypothetical protein
MVDIYNGVLFSHKEEWNYVVCSKKKMDGTEDHQVKQNITYFLSNVDSRWTTKAKKTWNYKGDYLEEEGQHQESKVEQERVMEIAYNQSTFY